MSREPITIWEVDRREAKPLVVAAQATIFPGGGARLISPTGSAWGYRRTVDRGGVYLTPEAAAAAWITKCRDDLTRARDQLTTSVDALAAAEHLLATLIGGKS